jgi:hypothetical protein
MTEVIEIKSEEPLSKRRRTGSFLVIDLTNIDTMPVNIVVHNLATMADIAVARIQPPNLPPAFANMPQQLQQIRQTQQQQTQQMQQMQQTQQQQNPIESGCNPSTYLFPSGLEQLEKYAKPLAHPMPTILRTGRRWVCFSKTTSFSWPYWGIANVVVVSATIFHLLIMRSVANSYSHGERYNTDHRLLLFIYLALF